MFKDEDRKIILTEAPYLFVNDDIRNIINEIRQLILDDFKNISEQMQIPIINLSLGITTFSNNIMHFFEVDCYNIREIQKIMLD
jgi:hypothetical protein